MASLALLEIIWSLKAFSDFTPVAKPIYSIVMHSVAELNTDSILIRMLIQLNNIYSVSQAVYILIQQSML